MLAVDDFFVIATQEEDWHEEEKRETVKRFQNLVSVLKQKLSQLQVYRVGSTDIDAYIVGVGNSWWRIGGAVYETGGDLIATDRVNYDCLLII
jgi:hypothetical protein